MKLELAIVSDTHWREHGPDLDRLIHRIYGAHYVLHAGDAVSPAILQGLEQVAPVLAVQGNCCQAALRQAHPTQRQDRLQGLTVAMVHGHLVDLEDPLALLERFPEAQLVIHGHSHVPRRELHGGRWLFNPGSVSEPRWGNPPTYGWATWEDGRLELEHRLF